MKKFIIITCLIFVISTASYSFLYGESIKSECNEKIQIINRLLENPDEYYNIIKNSKYYSDEIYGEQGFAFKRFDMFFKDQLKEYKGKCVVTYECYDPKRDLFTLRYLGNNLSIAPALNISFTNNINQSYLNELSEGPPFYFVSSKDDIEYLKEVRNKELNDSTVISETNFLKSEIIESKKHHTFLNHDYDFCNKIEFINILLDKDLKLDSLVITSEFTKGNKTLCGRLDSSFYYLEEYLSKFEFNSIWFNYPFPINNRNVEIFLNQNEEKDYFIIEFTNDKDDLTRPNYLTFEFIKKENVWQLNNIMKGTQIYLVMVHDLGDIEPYSD